MKERSYEGSFTVYFSMILLSSLALFLGILWISRYRIEKNDALRMKQAAGASVLSCYNAELADQYGLYGTPVSQLEQRMTDFIEVNTSLPRADIYSRPSYLLAPKKLWEGLFRYQLKDVSVSNVKTLADEQVFQEQINSFMKYRILQETILEYLTILQSAAQGSGIQARYARIQSILMEYNGEYGKLVQYLYPEGHQDIYVTITQEEEYSPQRLYNAVVRLQNDEIQLDEDWAVLALWQEEGEVLHDQNQRANECIVRLQEYIQELTEELKQWEQMVQGLSSEERLQAQSAIASVEDIKNQVWGLHGETRELQESLQKNLQATEKLEVLSRELLTLNSKGEPIEEEKWQEMRRAAKNFLEYEGEISLEYTKNAGGNQWNLEGIWKWIQKFHVDLKKYGADQIMIEDTGESRETTLFTAIQQIEDGSQNIVSEAINKAALVEYCLGMCKNLSDQLKPEKGEATYNLRGEPFGETFFKNEGEFLQWGNYNEYENLRGVQFQMLGLRLVMNMTYLIGSPEKQAMIQQAAQSTGGIIAPGVGTGIAYGAILFLWSAAESYVDYGVLIQNGKVPLMKNDDNWQTDLQSVLEKGYKIQETPEQEGLDYEMYLRLLLHLSSGEVLIQRLQTLIQLNMQKQGMEGFILTDMAVGFDATTEIQGKTSLYITGEGFEYE